MGKQYTIITTIYKVGQIVAPCDKENVRSECEKMIKLHKLQKTKEHLFVEVVNNETGEVREYYNSQENKIQF